MCSHSQLRSYNIFCAAANTHNTFERADSHSHTELAQHSSRGSFLILHIHYDVWHTGGVDPELHRLYTLYGIREVWTLSCTGVVRWALLLGPPASRQVLLEGAVRPNLKSED